MNVRAMNRKILYRIFVSTLSVLGMGCMDVSPPSVVSVSKDELLHSVVLPFQKAIYGVGDVDSISVYARLVSGDSLLLLPTDFTWQIIPTQSAVTIDSAGIIRVNQYRSTPTARSLQLVVSYTTGSITRSATASLFITENSYDVRTFTLKALDSAKGASMTLSSFLSGGSTKGLPQFEVEIKDVNNSVVPILDYAMHLQQFTVRQSTGARVPNNISLRFSPTGTYANAAAPVGRYWVGLSGRLYGKNYQDSILFTQLAPAEAGFSISASGGSLAIVVAAPGIIQPCASIPIMNLTNDTIVLELSQPQPERTCDGEWPQTGPIIVPGRYQGVARVLGYNSGTVLSWKLYAKENLHSPAATGKWQFADIDLQ